MRLTHAPCLSLYRLPPHNVMPMCDKSVIDGLHPMIIFKTQVMFYKPKLFLCHFSNDHFIYKTIVSFVSSGFLGSHCWLCTMSTIFGLSLSECNKPVRVFNPRECLALLAITRHKFYVSCNRATLLDFVQQY